MPDPQLQDQASLGYMPALPLLGNVTRTDHPTTEPQFLCSEMLHRGNDTYILPASSQGRPQGTAAPSKAVGLSQHY